jgi:hypothetical protein
MRTSAADEAEHGHAPRDETGHPHQVAEDDPVADADAEAGGEQERPVVDGHQRLRLHEQPISNSAPKAIWPSALPLRT